MCQIDRGAWRRRLGVWACCLPLAAAGCNVGPDFLPLHPLLPSAYAGVPTPVPPAPTPAVSAGMPTVGPLIHWWTAFHDPVLTGLVDKAVKNNLDVRLAEARIRQARASRDGAAAGGWPAVDLTGAFTRSRAAGPAVAARNLYKAGLDAAWELDLFGGTRRGVEAAEADIEVSIEDRRGVLVSLAAEVALNYIDLRTYQQRLAVARKTLKAQQHTADVMRQKKKGGLIGALDVAGADAQVAATASQVPPLEASAQQTIYTLSVLLGREPGALLGELSAPSEIPTAPPEAPVGVPSDLLRRRPDIRKAEAAIHAATARVGVATAELFPKISLSAGAGFQGSELAAWTQWYNRFWSIGPSVSWRAFDAGRLRADIEVQDALREQSLITYRQTVLTALQDVENALVASAKEQDRRQPLLDAVAANRKALDLAVQLYPAQTDFLRVLDAQRALYSSQDALVQSNRAVSTNLVALYKALGGGWAEEPQPAPTTRPQGPRGPVRAGEPPVRVAAAP